MKRLSVVVLPLALVASGCVELPETVPTPTGLVYPLFDPAGSPDADPPVPPSFPSPTDLAKDRATGLLTGIPDGPTDSDAQKAFNKYLRTLNGFPTSATAEVRFSGKLDPKTVTAQSVLVFNLTDNKQVTGLTLEYREDDKVVDAAIGAVSMLRIWNFKGWERGKNYAFYVLTGPKGVKAKDGKDLIRSALFELAFGENPLCAWNDKYAWDADKKECTESPGGKTQGVALGCCTDNYSGLLESVVAKGVFKSSEAEHEALEEEVRRAVLGRATQFEAIRRGYDQLAKAAGAAAGVKRESLAIVFNFTTVGVNEAVFNPAVSPPQLPRPTDLAYDPVKKRLAVPMAADASPAEKEFNAYLSELDGWQLTSAPTLGFTGMLDPTSVSKTSGGKPTYPFKLYEVDLSATPPKLTQVAEDSLKAIYSDGGYCALKDPANCTASYAPSPCTKDSECKSNETCTFAPNLALSRADGLKRGTRYLVLAMAGDGGLKNKETTVTAAPIRSALMQLILQDTPLCDWDAGKKQCCDWTDKSKGCKFAGISSFIDDPKVVPGGRTAAAKGTLFETLRQGNDGLLKVLAATDKSFKRDDVIAAWTFGTTTLSEMAYDTTGAVIPFPNAVLMNQTTGKVNLPAGVVSDDLTKGLNKLDGFTNQGSAWSPYFGEVKPSTVAFGTSMVALDLDAGIPITSYGFSADTKAKAVLATPTGPLKEGGNFGVVMVSRQDKGKLTAKGGMTDQAGNRVIPSTFLALIRNRHKLFDKCKSQVSSLGPALAYQAETARVGHKPLFDALENSLAIPREDVATAWTYKTQTFTKQFETLHGKAMAAHKAVKLAGAYVPGTTGMPAAVPKADIGGWVPAGTFKTLLAIDETKGTFLADVANGKTVDVPFMLVAPKAATFTGKRPVVIFNHAINRNRTDMLAVANTLAKAGMITIAFDTIYHGLRSWCTEDAHCTAGTCTIATGKCGGGKLKVDAKGIEEASGMRFLNTDNALAIRDNMQQHAIDVSALVADIGVTPTLGGASLDKDKIYLVGQNVGSNLGAVAMANEPLIKRAVFNTGGAPLVDVLVVSSGTQDLITEVLKKFNVQKDTRGYLQLLTIFHTVLDPGDAGNWGGKVGAANAIVQLAGKDTVIPKSFGEYMAKQIGVSTAKTTYANQGHGFLLSPAAPDSTPAATGAAQTQMVTFLLSGAICTPNTTTGKCL